MFHQVIIGAAKKTIGFRNIHKCWLLTISQSCSLRKGGASFSDSYTSEKYYNHFVLNFLQNDHLKLQTPLIKVRKSGKQYVTKKDLKKVEPQSKEFLLKFTEKHPEVLEEFKKQRNTKSLRNTEIRDINIKDVCEILGAKLVQISTGNNNASAFHNIILGILEPIFYPTLINPVKGREIHDGRKRIDITFDNAAEDGIFYRLPENMNLPCPFIFIECKNYSSDP